MAFLKRLSVLSVACLATKLVASIDKKHTDLAAIQPAFPRIDLIGISSADDKIWHKADPYGNGSWTDFQLISEPIGEYPPVLVSWGAKRLDSFYVAESQTVYHVYTGNGGRQWAFDEDLGSPKVSSPVSAVARGQGIIDLIVQEDESSGYAYKQWDYKFNTEEGWLSLGGKFSSAPAAVSWAPDRLDVIGLDDPSGNIKHRFAYKASPTDTNLTWAWEWIDLGGGSFKSTPSITSWGWGRLDIWAIDLDGILNHKYLQNRGGDWWEWSAWEKLGGNFEDTPKVVSWDVFKFTIVGKFGNETQYRSKDLYDDGNGNWWHPSVEGWYEKGGEFAGEPAVVAAKGKNWIYIFGVADDGHIKLQLFDGGQWLPSGEEYYDLGESPALSNHDDLLRLVHQDLKI